MQSQVFQRLKTDQPPSEVPIIAALDTKVLFDSRGSCKAVATDKLSVGRRCLAELGWCIASIAVAQLPALEPRCLPHYLKY